MAYIHKSFTCTLNLYRGIKTQNSHKKQLIFIGVLKIKIVYVEVKIYEQY